ncbi:hypothetical protein PR202_ga17290 [Eleusine coracana subsp. coracana]|uniref:F-box domain-containing protein n=1 Tax=Eleusine coracana subsp. coracana TaxID=191504 RepID=A0AAV5CQE5_ELECO|nr:hypothetical protein PR202_ga17290 [Eleusine coracana subsp. coracana]
MGTAARRGKKRKAPHVEPQGGEGNNDLISSLPNTILDEIISLLPTNDGARTQILAHQWPHIWRSATINLDHSSLPASKETKVSLISWIIAEHKGPIRRFSVPALYLQGFPGSSEDLAWVISSW